MREWRQFNNKKIIFSTKDDTKLDPLAKKMIFDIDLTLSIKLTQNGS
jgi:hypothetical protein